jgi:hypothetical protein
MAGQIKILVVTSAAETGVNIAECDMIILYNALSVRILSQLRQPGSRLFLQWQLCFLGPSRSILLALDNATEQSEFQDIQKEVLMYEFNTNIQEHDDDTLRQMVG